MGNQHTKGKAFLRLLRWVPKGTKLTASYSEAVRDCALVLACAAIPHTMTSAPGKFSVFHTNLIEGVEVYK